MAERAADDHAEAQVALTQTAQWFRKAAEQGYADSQYRLWDLLSAGRGAKRDLAAAARWLGKAAFQGHPDAAKVLAKKVLQNRD